MIETQHADTPIGSPTEASQADSRTVYQNYDQWKGWDTDRFMSLSDPVRAYYRSEFAGMPIAGEKVLEVGFGQGSLLAWLKEQGAEVYGTELSEQGKALAQARGIVVLSPDLQDADNMAGAFGMIVAFDVLEHLTLAEIRSLLEKAATLLRDGGYFVARFPNGGSPFARALQHGDITHVSTLTVSKINQIMLDIPLHLARSGEPRAYFHGGLHKRVAKRARNLARSGFERMISMLYGITDPLSANLILVLQK